ncbi:MAG: hypothetical protein Q8P67_14875, partial [archaeon]|nr:hypothetical protein [archaeon]
AVGCMIQSHPDQRVRGKLVDSLMALPNKSWREAIRLANDSIESLRSVECANTLAAILKTNERVCFSVGQSFSAQMARMFQDMLHLYKTYSGFVTKAVTEEGAEAIHFALVRAIRSTKKEVLRLVETFVMKTNDPETISSKFVPPILEAVLGDYHRSHPDARDAEVLSLFAAIINKLQGSMSPLIPDVLKGVFECTLAMIKKNFQDYPDHRVFFFTLLRAIFSHCFRSLFNIPKTYFKMIVDSIVWATRHTLRPVSETGLLLMQDLWRNMAKSGAASAFFSSFYIKLFSEVFYVLTDRSHKFGFALQSSILKDMIYAVQTNAIDTPIYQPEGGEEKPNDIYLKNFILNLIGKHFPNVGQSNAKSFVIGLFDHCRELPEFKTHLRDFLVQLQEFSPDDNQDLDLLYSEENEAKEKMRIAAERRRNMRIPGMIAPASIEDPMMED